MLRLSPVIVALLLLAPVGGCQPPVEPCDEFDPPAAHRPTSCPPKPADQGNADRPSPPRYCYRTLAQVDCYDQPQPGQPNYLGSRPDDASPP